MSLRNSWAVHGSEGHDLYDESADGREQIKRAVKQASDEGKRVLVMWGANWCGWCRHLEEQQQTSDEISKLLSEHYVSIHIDVGHRDKHMDLALEYGLDFDELYIAHMMVLDRDGEVVGNKQPDALAVTTKDGKQIYSQSRIAEFLEKHRGKEKEENRS